jgi:hypothetical protein
MRAMSEVQNGKIGRVRLCDSGYAPFPNFFKNEMLTRDLPASFWVFTFAVWVNAYSNLYHVMNDLDPFFTQGTLVGSCELALRQFNMDKNTAGKWATAYSCSRIIKVEYATIVSAGIAGSHYYVNFNASRKEWVKFLSALEKTLSALRKPSPFRQKLGCVDDFQGLLTKNLLAEDEMTR